MTNTGWTTADVMETDAAYIDEFLAQSAGAMATFAADRDVRACLQQMASRVAVSLRNGQKLLLAGNGGSAGDAQHIAGEFTSRLMYDRRPLAAIALTTDTSGITAIGNDYGFEFIFSRQIEAIGRPGDVFLGISTSGRSPNIIRALSTARQQGLVTLGFSGADVSEMALCDELLTTPSNWTPIVQQLHIVAAHILCALVERSLCPR